MNETVRPHRIVVMGVAGSGKTTIGTALAERLGLPFADADDFHPAANVAKMRGGEPLTEQEVLGNLKAMVGAGHETTISLILNAVRAARIVQCVPQGGALLHRKVQLPAQLPDVGDPRGQHLDAAQLDAPR